MSHMDEQKSVEECWEFWAPLVCNEDGSLNLESVKKELADFSMIMRLSPVIMHATGQRCSKLNTNPSVIISLIDEHIDECIESALEDERLAPVIRNANPDVGQPTQMEASKSFCRAFEKD